MKHENETQTKPIPSSEELTAQAVATTDAKTVVMDEFSITELEERLEFEAWCDVCPP